MTEHLSGVDLPPPTRWEKILKWPALYGSVAAAGYLRFDLDRANEARAVALIPLLAFAAFVWWATRHAMERTRALMAQPDGFARFGAEVTAKKRAEWEEMRKQGHLRYTLRTALKTSRGTLPLIYAAAIMLPGTEHLLPRRDRVPGVMSSFLFAAALTLLAAAFIGSWAWNRAARGWARIPTPPT